MCICNYVEHFTFMRFCEDLGDDCDAIATVDKVHRHVAASHVFLPRQKRSRVTVRAD